MARCHGLFISTDEHVIVADTLAPEAPREGCDRGCLDRLVDPVVHEEPGEV